MTASIFRAVAKDAPLIAAAEMEYIDLPWTEEQILDEIEKPGALFLTARLDGEFAGYISADVVLDECEINNIAVERRFRGKSVGSALLSRLLEEAEGRGARKAFLLVRDGNAPALALYSKFGFKRTGVRKCYYKGQDAIAMSREISFPL